MMQGQHLFTQILFFSFIFFVVNLSNLTVKAQNLPPARYDGFVYENRQGDLDSILIEAFYDPVCPDSSDSWPPLKEALKHYGSCVWLVVHLLPLPYHDNAFVTSRALHIANALNSSFTFPLLEQFFKHQEKFYNSKTSNLSKVAILKEVVKFATVVVGNSYSSAFESGFNDRQTDLKTRVSFKYSTSRGVFGTPFFFVNGFLLPDAGSSLDYNGWRRIIDPLVGAKSSQSIKLPHSVVLKDISCKTSGTLLYVVCIEERITLCYIVLSTCISVPVTAIKCFYFCLTNSYQARASSNHISGPSSRRLSFVLSVFCSCLMLKLKPSS